MTALLLIALVASTVPHVSSLRLKAGQVVEKKNRCNAVVSRSTIAGWGYCQCPRDLILLGCDAACKPDKPQLYFAAHRLQGKRCRCGRRPITTTETTTTTAAVSKPINAVLEDFYSLFEFKSCKSFSELFSENGSFLHPAVPQGSRGSQELKTFCKGTQEIDDNFRINDPSNGMTDYLSLFRPDGPFMYLKSNGLSAILQPYFWSNLQKRADGTFGHVANSGWQAITMNDNFKMVSTVEFWTTTATQRGVRPEIDALLDKLYSLFEIKSCDDWASVWTADGRFLHPAIPGGLTGTAQLVANCNGAQGMNDFNVSESGVSGPYRALFRPAGPYMLTESGGLITVLQPYIFTILRSSASKYSQFANSGWEVATIKKQPDGSMKFVQVIEYWSRDVQPFQFDPNQ